MRGIDLKEDVLSNARLGDWLETEEHQDSFSYHNQIQITAYTTTD